MSILSRLVKNILRRNTNPSPVIDETLYAHGKAYVDPLVFRGYNNFLNKIDKRASMYSDPIVNTLTLGWANIATAKTFKFYESHEIGAAEVMEEWRAWWMENNLDELLKAVIPHFCMDGWVLLDLFLEGLEEGEEGEESEEGKSINYEVYGSFECDTIHWKRDIENNIYYYDVKFIPFPSPTGWAWGGSSLRSIHKEYKGNELLHFTRGDWNYGVGKSRIAPVWDPILKLRHGSYADFFRRDMRFIVAVPQGWQKPRIDSFAQSFDGMMRGSNRMFVYKMSQADGPDKTPLELPRFGMESLARPAPKPMSQSEAGGELLRDPEWARLLAGTQLTENYFIGNQAGAVTGSEVDLTRDFYTECQEFGLLEPMIKAIINWFVMAGLIPQPPGNYVVKYWKDWEHIEKEAMLMQQEAQQWEQEQGKAVAGESKRAELRQQSIDIYNNDEVERLVINALTTNVNMPTTPVSSTWISHVAVKGKRLFVKIPGWDKGPWAGFQFSDEDVAGMKGREMMESGSRGAWMWDNIWAGGGKGPRPLQPGINEGISGIIYSKDPFGGEAEVTGFGTFESRKEELLHPSTGHIGTEKTRRPLGTPSSTQKSSVQIPSYVPFEESRTEGFATAEGSAPQTPGYTASPSSITGSIKTGPGRKRARGKSSSRPAIIPYNPTISLKNSAPKLNSQAYIKKLGVEMGWGGMSNSTAQKIMALVKIHELNNLPRYNSIVIGNVMDFDVLLRYPDAPNGEKACKKEWIKINAHEGDLYLYEDLGHGGKRINVGKYKYWWDDKEGKNVVKYNKEEVFEAIEKLLNSWGVTNSEIQTKIKNGLAPDLSTEYYAGSIEVDGIIYQTNFHNRKGEPVFEGIAIVERGNCSAPACEYEIIEEVA